MIWSISFMDFLMPAIVSLCSAISSSRVDEAFSLPNNPVGLVSSRCMSSACWAFKSAASFCFDCSSSEMRFASSASGRACSLAGIASPAVHNCSSSFFSFSTSSYCFRKIFLCAANCCLCRARVSFDLYSSAKGFNTALQYFLILERFPKGADTSPQQFVESRSLLAYRVKKISGSFRLLPNCLMVSTSSDFPISNRFRTSSKPFFTAASSLSDASRLSRISFPFGRSMVIFSTAALLQEATSMP